MKIISLDIKNYKQFTDLKLDLTYPKGHQKEGEPLDKICIIGQSGTGKTNLLKVIRDKLNNSEVVTKFKEEKTSKDEKVYFVGVEKKINYIKENYTISKENEKVINDLKRKRAKIVQSSNYILEDNYAHSEIEVINNEIEELKVMNYSPSIQHGTKKQNFINIDDNNTWEILKTRIDNYDIEKGKYSKQLGNKLVHDSNYSKEEFIIDIRSWEKENENILENIADDINSIIKKFNLELKIDENTNSYEELIIKDLSNGNIIDYDDISTGTKNLLSTFIPLKSYNPKEASFS